MELITCTVSFLEEGHRRKQLLISYLSLRLRLLSLDHNRHLRSCAALQATLLTKVRCVLTICKSLENKVSLEFFEASYSVPASLLLLRNRIPETSNVQETHRLDLVRLLPSLPSLASIVSQLLRPQYSRLREKHFMSLRRDWRLLMTRHSATSIDSALSILQPIKFSSLLQSHLARYLSLPVEYLMLQTSAATFTKAKWIGQLRMDCLLSV